MPYDTWKANMHAIAGYLRKETDTLVLKPGTDEIKETFLMKAGR
eukprot:COSAG02_NODE_66963_length_254_cov_0.664516_1_plen_44_part_10